MTMMTQNVPWVAAVAQKRCSPRIHAVHATESGSYGAFREKGTLTCAVFSETGRAGRVKDSDTGNGRPGSFASP
jgi:hypothetical protein